MGLVCPGRRSLTPDRSALLASGALPGDVLGALWATGILGAAPLALGVTIARNRARTREWWAAAH